MKTKYWLCKRNEIFFSFDSTTGKRESLHTADREAAKQIIRAKNDAATQPAINISIAKAYLVGTDPKLVERTWAFVIQEFCAVKKDSSRLRRERAIKSAAFNFIRNKRLVETTADDFQNVLKSGGVFTQHTLRCLHNLALGTRPQPCGGDVARLDAREQAELVNAQGGCAFADRQSVRLRHVIFYFHSFPFVF
jgi:hypothetical protein